MGSSLCSLKNMGSASRSKDFGHGHASKSMPLKCVMEI